MADKIIYYHGSPTGGLKALKVQKPQHFDKDARVYLTSLYPMALIYGIKNFEYTYGYTQEGGIYFSEYFDGAFEKLYAKKSGYIYVCAPKSVEKGSIPNEFLAHEDVEIIQEIFIPDLLEALKEQAKMGSIELLWYKDLSERRLKWIEDTFLKIIKDNDLLNKDTPYAKYVKENYPQIWQKAEKNGL